MPDFHQWLREQRRLNPDGDMSINETGYPKESDDGGGAIAVIGTEGGEVAAATALLLPGTVTEPEPGQAAVDDTSSPFDYVQEAEPGAPNDTDIWLKLDPTNYAVHLQYYDEDDGWFDSIPSSVRSQAVDGGSASVEAQGVADHPEGGDSGSLTLTAAVPTGQTSVIQVNASKAPAEAATTQILMQCQILTLDVTSLIAASLPTADPEFAGALWNDSGTLKVSAG